MRSRRPFRIPGRREYELKLALHRRYGVPVECIVLGNGSSDIFDLAARAFLTPKHEAVYSQYAFAAYRLAVEATGARAVRAPAQNYGHDLSAMRCAISRDTRIVFIADPNNPTGTVIGGAELEAFIAAVPSTRWKTPTDPRMEVIRIAVTS